MNTNAVKLARNLLANKTVTDRQVVVIPTGEFVAVKNYVTDLEQRVIALQQENTRLSLMGAASMDYYENWRRIQHRSAGVL